MRKDQHRTTMIELARERGWRRGIELGLGSGLLFDRFLGEGLQMIGVDLGERPDRKARCEQIRQAHLDRAEIMWMRTSDAANLVPDAWADFVFVDAGHSYAAAAEDIRLWQSKVRPGGWFGGHDYHPAFPGVMQAVGEAFGDRIELLDGWIWSRI